LIIESPQHKRGGLEYRLQVFGGIGLVVIEDHLAKGADELQVIGQVTKLLEQYATEKLRRDFRPISESS
jgi:hypothetical protein